MLNQGFTLFLIIQGFLNIYNTTLLFTINLQEQIALIILTILLNASLIALVAYGYLAMITDTTDKAIYFQKQNDLNDEKIRDIRNLLSYHCSICRLMI